MTQDTLKNLLPKFIKNLEENGRSPSTILAYRADLDQMIVYLQKKNKVITDQIIPTDIETFRDTLLSQKYTPKTVSRKLNAVKSFFRWMIAERLTASDPSKNVSHPKIEASLPKFLNQIQYRALRDIVRDDVRIAAIVELILQTGLRISEVANLKLNNIKDSKIVVEPYATQPSREVPLNKQAKESLEAYLKERPKSESNFIFVSKNAKPLAVRNIRAAVDRYFQKAEMPNYSVNDLRTTFIVENLKAGIDLVLLSQIVGHKRLSTTERYLEMANSHEPGKKQTLEEL
jgi:site-specific recombinase XerD